MKAIKCLPFALSFESIDLLNFSLLTGNETLAKSGQKANFEWQ
jgi:hypothetical protein